MPNFYKFKIGNFNCISFQDQAKKIPLKYQFPQVAEEKLINALSHCGLSDMVPKVGFNLLYIDTGFHKILVDSGYPNLELLESLKMAGIEHQDIEAIFITHGDGDHIGGVDNFPNAQIYMPEKAYELWTTEKGQQQMIKEFEWVFKKLVPAENLPKVLASRLKYGTEVLPKNSHRIFTIDPRRPIFPGIRMMEAFGHRSDHYAIEIESNGKTLLHIVDAFRHPIQLLHPEWTSFVDSFPEQTTATIKKLVKKAQNKNAMIFGTHFPFPSIGRIQDGQLKHIERVVDF